MTTREDQQFVSSNALQLNLKFDPEDEFHLIILIVIFCGGPLSGSPLARTNLQKHCGPVKIPDIQVVIDILRHIFHLQIATNSISFINGEESNKEIDS